MIWILQNKKILLKIVNWGRILSSTSFWLKVWLKCMCWHRFFFFSRAHPMMTASIYRWSRRPPNVLAMYMTIQTYLCLYASGRTRKFRWPWYSWLSKGVTVPHTCWVRHRAHIDCTHWQGEDLRTRRRKHHHCRRAQIDRGQWQREDLPASTRKHVSVASKCCSFCVPESKTVLYSTSWRVKFTQRSVPQCRTLR